MNKPKDVAMRDPRASIHLHGAITLAQDELITESSGKLHRVVRASAVRDDNLSFRRSLAQMLKK
jgi:hypothetical protein